MLAGSFMMTCDWTASAPTILSDVCAFIYLTMRGTLWVRILPANPDQGDYPSKWLSITDGDVV